jgi:hypothetical protein
VYGVCSAEFNTEQQQHIKHKYTTDSNFSFCVIKSKMNDVEKINELLENIDLLLDDSVIKEVEKGADLETTLQLIQKKVSGGYFYSIT